MEGAGINASVGLARDILESPSCDNGCSEGSMGGAFKGWDFEVRMISGSSTE